MWSFFRMIDVRGMFSGLGSPMPPVMAALGNAVPEVLGALSDQFEGASGGGLAGLLGGGPIAPPWYVPPPNIAAAPAVGYAASNPYANPFLFGDPYGRSVDMFDQMNRAAGPWGGIFGGANPFSPMMYNGFGNILGGTPGPTQGAFGLGRSDGNDVAGVLNDPALTVEDKVTLMIMLIMKKMDKDIEQQSQAINKLQQQQQGGQGGGGGGKGGKGGGGGGAGGDKSIDVETMKLKRLIDKRGQMFDMLRQIIDKYNQTAKGIIDSIGR